MYSPELGRFLSEDPIQEGTNWYEFAGNDPVNRADPTGLYQQGHPLSGGFSGNQTTAPTVKSGNILTAATMLYEGAKAIVPQVTSFFNSALNSVARTFAASLAAPVWDWDGAPGHHPVPQAVTKRLGSILSEDAVKIFNRATSGDILYSHGSDPWKGISHQQYSDSVEAILSDYGGRLQKPVSDQQARQFVQYIEQGIIPKDDAALNRAIKANKGPVAAVKTWRAGFAQSVAEAATARQAATELGIELSNSQVKAIAQQRVNGAVTAGMEKHLDTANVRAVERHLSKLAQAGKLGKFAAGALKKAAPALAVMSAANAYAHGSRNGHRGMLGAADQSIADLMSADLAEDYILRPAATKGANFVEQALGGGISNQRHRRNGFDDAGRPLDPRDRR